MLSPLPCLKLKNARMHSFFSIHFQGKKKKDIQMGTRATYYCCYNYHQLDASLLLVEDSGDSEADAGSNWGLAHLPNDDDDAESCSWDTSDPSRVSDLIGNPPEAERVGDAGHHHGKKPNKEEEKGEETSGYNENWSAGGGEGRVGLKLNQKSCVSEESATNEPLSEVERNRLFWEACLAS